jgi:RNA polymerase sigma factor (sigma-70 family)
MAQPRLKSNFDKSRAGFDSSYSDEAHGDNPALMKTLDEGTLLDSIVTGNKAAMAEIFDRYAHVCYAIALRILDAPTSAEEVTREVLLDVWRQPANYTARRSELPVWLSLVTRRRALEVRDLGRRTDNENSILLPNPRELGLSNHQAWRLDKFKRIVAALPAEQKQVLELVWFKGLNSTELASQTGQSLATVQSRLLAAVQTMQRALDAHE